MSLFSSTIQSLDHALDYSSTKQKVISQNIANGDTPNYKAKNVSMNRSFSSVLQSSVESYRTDERHYKFSSPSNQATVVSQNNVSYGNDGNSVDVDKEMSELATNQIYYNALIERTSGKFSSLLNVIKGGR